ncbi:hypothetical protein [Rasiella sp. SM2506]|uniref:hypothetical protein n=1 Tax=Rasiella sp. SM2506 TaxID=3423914 RepID=UPI003D7C0063
MNHKKMLFIFAGIAIALISLGFLIGSEEPYASIWQVAVKFFLLSFLVFAIQALCYFFGYRMYKIVSRGRLY